MLGFRNLQEKLLECRNSVKNWHQFSTHFDENKFIWIGQMIEFPEFGHDTVKFYKNFQMLVFIQIANNYMFHIH